jgi:hypothetical protein
LIPFQVRKSGKRVRNRQKPEDNRETIANFLNQEIFDQQVANSGHILFSSVFQCQASEVNCNLSLYQPNERFSGTQSEHIDLPGKSDQNRAAHCGLPGRLASIWR